MAEVEQALPAGGFRVRILRDNDQGFKEDVLPHLHARAVQRSLLWWHGPGKSEMPYTAQTAL